ncbi:MAG TPA: endolytic transglycosylase MltG [Candidatus Limivivens intestinipullorum]|uniref:Endolytic transglycosylase MltG n=1 Tax=Candidatus Limivivens intestinipullorum TaxID=2840858 RepID=A0A9D1JK44_9FIRM|nr:endolytic transglycosylase MltG [Candidatus Limivivens intestinipullorum]
MKKRSTAAFAGICGLKTAVLAVIVLCLIRLGGQAYSFGYRVFAQETVSESPGRNVAVTISEGMSGKEIGELLEGRGLIRDAAVFRVQFALSDYKNAIVPGSYILNTSQTAEEMLAILAGQQETESE